MTECRPGAVHDLRGILDDLGPATVLLVRGGESYRRSGAAEAIEPMLAPLSVATVCDVAPNPTVESVAEAITRFREAGPDVVVAVGGGSVLDLAKAARGLANEPDPRAAIRSGTVSDVPAVPLVAVPTTAGTGSEATHFSAVYVDGVKHSVGHPAFRPDHVVLDPELTTSMSPRTTAETGLDALSQAMESLWSTRSTEESRAHAQRALELAWGSLEQAVRAPTMGLRVAMCEAAHLSGLAIDVSRTTAAHALAYSITVRHGVAHGHAVALTLGPLLEYNGAVSPDDCVDPRGADFVRARIEDVLAVLGARDGSEGRQALASLMERIGLEASLSGAGVTTQAARRAIVDAVDADRLANNPRVLDTAALHALVREAA
jgi:alcohol dehydrogenase class IV